MHGVFGDFSRDEKLAEKETDMRFTLIVNWWSREMFQSNQVSDRLRKTLTKSKGELEFNSEMKKVRAGEEIDVTIDDPRNAPKASKAAELKLNFASIPNGMDWNSWRKLYNRFNEIDVNRKDGMVSKKEFVASGAPVDAFNTADWDKDGIIVWEEFWGTMTGGKDKKA